MRELSNRAQASAPAFRPEEALGAVPRPKEPMIVSAPSASRYGRRIPGHVQFADDEPPELAFTVRSGGARVRPALRPGVAQDALR
jgi:hypothetical protein